jgi:L-ectoine synthase
MRIIHFENLKNTSRDVKFPSGMVSLRALLESDGMGFSLHKTIIPVGPAQHWHYTKHFEACYCISGWGVLTNLATGDQEMIREDMLYVLDKHDDHTFQALEPTILISVFNPPCKGNETHKEDGSYE